MRVLDSKRQNDERRLRSLERVTAEEILNASSTISNLFSPTRVIQLPTEAHNDLSGHWLKLETETPTGSFKARGAAYFVSKCAANQFSSLVTASTGNHGASLAWACKKNGMNITVVAPKDISRSKLARLEEFGANIILHGNSLNSSIVWARDFATKRGFSFVPSFNPTIIIGHASLGVEIFYQVKGLKKVFISIGVGSGAAGLALARDALSADVDIVGVVPSACDAWFRSFIAKKPLSAPFTESIAEGLRIDRPDADMFDLLRTRITDVLTVSESEIKSAQLELREKFLIKAEPSGSVAFAGLKKHEGEEKCLAVIGG